MPVKKRLAKSRRELSSEDLEDHFYGPGTALINGEGYCWPIAGTGAWYHLDGDQKTAVIEAMRSDWHRHRNAILQAWHDRDDHALWCAKHHQGDPEHPWSLTEFGN